jgi:hypothetical protein
MLLALTISFALAAQAAPARQASSGTVVQAIPPFSDVYRAWNVDCSIPGIDDLRIMLDVELDRNGEIVGRPVPVRPQDTPAYEAAAASALRALLEAAPFHVPEGFRGGEYRTVFIPGRVCREADED